MLGPQLSLKDDWQGTTCEKCGCLVGGMKAYKGLSWIPFRGLSGARQGRPGCLAGLIGQFFGHLGRVRLKELIKRYCLASTFTENIDVSARIKHTFKTAPDDI